MQLTAGLIDAHVTDADGTLVAVKFLNVAGVPVTDLCIAVSSCGTYTYSHMNYDLTNAGRSGLAVMCLTAVWGFRSAILKDRHSEGPPFRKPSFMVIAGNSS